MINAQPAGAQSLLCPGWHFDLDHNQPCLHYLAELYEDHALGCVEAATRTNDPKHREMLLKLAHEWMREAAALRASIQSTRA
jgi:hypothetical protein